MNKKVSSLILGLGLGLAALSTSARVPDNCEDAYYWCIDMGFDHSYCISEFRNCQDEF